MYNVLSLIFFIASLFVIQNDFKKFVCIAIISGIFGIAGGLNSIAINYKNKDNIENNN